MIIPPECDIEKLKERFWAKVDKSGPEGSCWIWTGGISPTSGYGRFNITHTLEIAAHRINFIFSYGEFDKSLKVCHTCDNRLCIRNDDSGFYPINGILKPRSGHLWIGTQQDNMDDKVAKGRQAIGKTSGSYQQTWSRGSKNSNHIVTENQVPIIFERWNNGHGETLRAIGESYGVTKHAIWRIIHKKNYTWLHIK